MKSFHTIAVADKDIIEGKLTMDVFAADLWETYLERAAPEYKEPKLFFEKTYLTKGLKNLLTVVEKRLKGGVSPGREALRRLLEANQPTLVLIDELLEYTTKAAGVPVRETSLAAQTIAFIQELTEVAGTLPKVCVVVTLPSSIIEHYDEKSERLFLQLQKVAGRVEKIYTPVQESEITQVIRRRLFSSVDKLASERIASEFLEYAE